MIVVPFRAEHALRLRRQPAQRLSVFDVTPALARQIEANSVAFTGVVDGDPVACGGVMPIWEGRVMLWTYVAEHAGRHFTAIHRAARRFLDGCPARRIEAYVDCDFAAGHRWARMLGFDLECERMRAFLPNGGDMAMYVRVR